MPPASDPAALSVSAKLATTWPLAIGRSHSSFCAGEPKRSKISQVGALCTLTIVETAHPECASEMDKWRQSRPWNTRISAAYRLLSANQIDSAEVYAKEAATLDRRSPFVYNAFAQIARTCPYFRAHAPQQCALGLIDHDFPSEVRRKRHPLTAAHEAIAADQQCRQVEADLLPRLQMHNCATPYLHTFPLANV